MKKLLYIYLCASAVMLNDVALANGPGEEETSAVPTLMFSTTKKAFDFKNDPAQRQKLKEKLKQHDLGFINALKFEGQVLDDIDLSGFCLLGLDFSGCTFNSTNLSKTNFRDVRLRRTILNNVNLRGADLRITLSDSNYFRGCIFNNVDLEGALLYGDKEEEYLYLKGTSEPFNLVRQYSDLMEKARVKRQTNSIKEAEILEKQAQAINKLFDVIILNLENQYLANLNLTHLNFKNANFKNAHLQGARLSEKVVVPDYKPYDSTPLFDKWMNGDKEEKELFQNLLNAGVNFFLTLGIGNNQLQPVNWASKNLKNANFSRINLSGCNFTGVNLKELNLKDAYVAGLRLSENVVVPNYESGDNTPIFDKWVQGTEEEKKLFQDLLNAGVNLFQGVLPHRLQQFPWASKNLKNANFSKVNLSDCNFIGVNLKELNLEDAYVAGLRLSENVVVPNYNEFDCTPLFDRWANSDDEETKELFQGLFDAGFKFTRGVDINRLQSFSWASKNIKNANFYTLDLTGFNFSGADLSQANLTGTNLTNTNFKGANLKRASICGVFLSGRDLPVNDPGHVQLSYNQPHKDLQRIYQSNSDSQVKRLAKQILKALGYPLQSENNP